MIRRFLQETKRVAWAIGDFQARVLLALFYFLILAPFALILRWKSDPLAIKPQAGTGWHPRSEREDGSTSWAQRQF